MTYVERNVFLQFLMDRTRRSPLFVPVLFVSVVAATMLLGAASSLVPAPFKLGAVIFSLVPLLITICGLISVLSEGKPANITVLGIIIMILATLLGPWVWFAWGRRNT